jgi:hypothetical protein
MQRRLLPDVEKSHSSTTGVQNSHMTVQRVSIGERVGKYFRKMFGDA